MRESSPIVGTALGRAPLERFHEDGFLLLPSVLSGAECGVLRDQIELAMAEVPAPWLTRWVRPQMCFRSRSFLELIDRFPVVDIVEELLSFGPEATCHILNSTSIVTRAPDPGQPWHIDDALMMPRAGNIAWDARITFPVFVITAQYFLSDVSETCGVTEVAPGSHKSGCLPPAGEDRPVFQGREAVPILAHEGDCLLFHHQLWHRPRPHTHPSPRWVHQVHYGARFIAQRFFPFPTMKPSARFLEDLTPRRQRLMGSHPCFAPYS